MCNGQQTCSHCSKDHAARDCPSRDNPEELELYQLHILQQALQGTTQDIAQKKIQKMEKVAISETVLPTQEKKDEEKKIEFNVNAKEFVPTLSQEVPLEESEAWNPDQQNNLKPVINKKIGENYKPVFMDGMTEKFIEGPYVGNGKDPEIPFVRYYSKGQAIDFFNKRYFSADPSGEILYRPGEGDAESGAGTEEHHQQKPFLDSAYFQSNIFRPPYIDFLVQDILHRQYLSSARPKAMPGGRRGGKQQFVAYSRGYGLPRAESKKDASTEPLPADSQEVWLEVEESVSKEVPTATSTPMDSPASSGKSEEAEPAKSEAPEEKQGDSPKEQRQAKVRVKSFTNSKLSPPDKFKLKNGQKKTDLNINYKNSKAEIVEKSPNSDEDQQSKKGVIAETKESPVGTEAACCINLQEDEDNKSIENLSIEVNITIDAPSKEYPVKEEAKAINL